MTNDMFNYMIHNHTLSIENIFTVCDTFYNLCGGETIVQPSAETFGFK